MIELELVVIIGFILIIITSSVLDYKISNLKQEIRDLRKKLLLHDRIIDKLINKGG